MINSIYDINAISFCKAEAELELPDLANGLLQGTLVCEWFMIQGGMWAIIFLIAPITKCSGTSKERKVKLKFLNGSAILQGNQGLHTQAR